MDVISLFESCKLRFLEDYAVKDTKAYLKDISNYSSDEQVAIKDMLANGIIYPIADSLNGSDYIFKGQLNELVVNFAEKYNTIALEGDTINTDPAKMPSNAYMYAYILSNVDKKIYEIPPLVNIDKSYGPKEMYEYNKEVYPQLKKYIDESFDSMLNVDYRTITEENFLEGVKKYFIIPPTDYMTKYYVDYVKKNEIILKGNCKLIAPTLYQADLSRKTRIKLDFEIVNSKTKNNVLFLDFYGVNNKIYQNTKYALVADYVVSTKFKDNVLYLGRDELYTTILEKEKSGIMAEE